jgi:hypothetical protein
MIDHYTVEELYWVDRDGEGDVEPESEVLHRLPGTEEARALALELKAQERAGRPSGQIILLAWTKGPGGGFSGTRIGEDP